MSERCVGCGIEADEQPMVGVGQPTDGLKDYQLPGDPSTRGFVAYGVCKTCWSDPAKRRRTLKLSFFSRSQLPGALAAAGSTTVKG